MTEDRYLKAYDLDTHKDVTYDLETYNPIEKAPEGGWTHEDRDALQRAASTRSYLIFARTKSDKVWKIERPPFNAKSIPLNDPRTPPHGGKQRLKYEELESLGTCSTINDNDDQADTVEATVAKTEPVAHAERDHALLSASSAHRWINCTPAPYLEAQHPDSTSDAAAEGTAAHELAEHKLRQHLDLPTTRPVSEWDSEEMDDYTDQYADHVMAELQRAREVDKAAFLGIEERLDFSHIVPEGFGTGDTLIVSDDTLTVVDLKYGKGVEVSAVGNPQMRLYALGALATYGAIYDVQTVRTVIFQPRLANISTEEISVDELTKWAENTVRPAAEKAIAGEGELRAGEWCRFCRHAAQCPERAREMFAPVPTTAEHVPAAPDPDTLTDNQIATIVAHSGELKKWLTKVESFALAQANEGRAYPGLKLVEGRSVRKYTDEDEVARVVEAAGEDPHKPREVLGITAMTKLLGKQRFEELLGDYVHKPEGKPALVPESDKRPALTPVSADTVFGHIEKGA
ncbi:DUF2800 domain-containing protein [Corynebacterium sp. HMSC11D10]|uniref:DUF2800 domain-containing protein n=1 Tax=Corynebacterium sp. HMSC11D10 TaxID=1581088 RepID=UPI0009F4C48E|nr:DUF2800 domain-containing protein [Corynebacterium sp. HMSC11D10]